MKNTGWDKLKTGMRGSNNGLLKLIKELPSDIIMAEIGCYAGESTLMFLQSGKVKQLFAIDTWSSKYDGEYHGTEEFIERINRMYKNMAWAEWSFDERVKEYKNVVKLKMSLKDAIDELPLLDFIYIDADHRYDAVKNDILLAKNIMKKAGIIAGHDYDAKESPGVILAVNEIFGKPDKIYTDKSWIIKSREY